MIKKTLSLLILAATVALGQAQNSYIPYKTYDGEHKNEVSGYVMGGNNVVTDGFGGLAASYTRHLTPRWHVGGDAQMQFGKELFSVDVKGGYRLPIKYGNIDFTGKVMYNYYHKFGIHEMAYNLSATWESAYVDIRIGESIVHYHKKDVVMGWGYTEPPLFTFGFGANIRHRNNPWNIGLFFRNYDDFYYENWNINWGIRWYAKVKDQWHLFGEFNIRPAGSMSQLASKYEGSVKVGLKYKW
ncbi:MAG: hypothetical protein II034_04785 [Muribaculaceae bacterium]|nr:hypothetical protein [Muribaculaceae bacterium]MBQ1723089.1 hypothetical protein [Muribaculaceae bacterium]MBQ2491266.1 hypothetical protein [Muribaculaceae bacterium]MBQ3961230.1 hypothetical protein [Muribaculaceae bacterium]MBQ4008569.1 hypothetical protein [Muribaculaceae bacterium]